MKALFVIGAIALLAGCQPAPKESETAKARVAAPEASACAEGAARLAVTGLCPAEAEVLAAHDPNARTPELPDCTWTIRELMLPGDEALLYRSATCKGVETELAFAGGAHRAEVSYLSSAVYGAAGAGRVVLALYGTDPDPQGALKAAIAEAPAAERLTCETRLADYEGWPTDALLIAPNAAARAELPKDIKVKACGPMGIDETKVSYWRVRQGFAWYFDLGAQDPDFDAGSMAVIARGADGVWKLKP